MASDLSGTAGLAPMRSLALCSTRAGCVTLRHPKTQLAVYCVFRLQHASPRASTFARKGKWVTKLLVSVRDAAEARTALAAGVDLIDVKEPHQGSLGAAAPEDIAAIAAVVGTQVPLSVACGELLDTRDVADVWSSGVLHGINYAKLGLAGCSLLDDWPDRWQRALARLPSSVCPVAVAYADWRTCDAPSAESVLHHALQLRCRALLVDTFDKSAGNLLTQTTLEELKSLASQVRSHGLMFVLAGSLDQAAINTVASIDPDYIAVRGAVCRGGREGSVDGKKVQEIKSLLSTACDTDADVAHRSSTSGAM